MNPPDAAALLFQQQAETWTFLGTSFAFREERMLLTAAHCVKGIDVKELAVLFPSNQASAYCVESVTVHPVADIAICRTEPLPSGLISPFSGVGEAGPGQEFIAFGFPEDESGPGGGRQPTARIFRGYFQRTLEFKSRFGYEYRAAELSIPAPQGLSGGPVLHGKFRAPVGIVTENFESFTTVHEEVETPEGKTVYRHVINYGVGLLLAGVAEWLTDRFLAAGSKDKSKSA